MCAAFTNSSVFRLKKTWERIGKTVIIVIVTVIILIIVIILVVAFMPIFIVLVLPFLLFTKCRQERGVDNVVKISDNDSKQETFLLSEKAEKLTVTYNSDLTISSQPDLNAGTNV